MTKFDILDNPFNISAFSRIIDVNNSLEVDFNEIQKFFEKYVEFEKFKIKDLRIPKLEKQESFGPVFSLALEKYNLILEKFKIFKEENTVKLSLVNNYKSFKSAKFLQKGESLELGEENKKSEIDSSI